MAIEKKKILLTSALFVSSLILSLLLGEMLLRWAEFEFRLFPVRIEFGWPNPVEMKDRYEVDEELLWVPKKYYAMIETLRDSKPAIVFMGDSCTAWGIYDRLFDSIIDQVYPDNHFTYVNTGVGGWTSYQGLQQLRRDVLPMQPRIVTFYYGWNDHWASFGVEDKDVGAFNSDRSLAMHFADWRLVQLFNFFAIKLYGNEEGAAQPRRVSDADFTKNLIEMVEQARDNGIVPVLITAPSSHIKGEEPVYLAERWLSDIDELVPLHQRYADLVREVAREEEVLLLDLLAKFYRLPAKDLKEKYFVEDGIHLTSEGCWEVANALYRFFEQEGLLEKILE